MSELNCEGCKGEDDGRFCVNYANGEKCKRIAADFYKPKVPEKPKLPWKISVPSNCFGYVTETRINEIIDYLYWFTAKMEEKK